MFHIAASLHKISFHKKLTKSWEGGKFGSTSKGNEGQEQDGWQGACAEMLDAVQTLDLHSIMRTYKENECCRLCFSPWRIAIQAFLLLHVCFRLAHCDIHEWAGPGNWSSSSQALHGREPGRSCAGILATRCHLLPADMSNVNGTTRGQPEAVWFTVYNEISLMMGHSCQDRTGKF